MAMGRAESEKRGGGGGNRIHLVERLPSTILINEILAKLDLAALCSAACTCRALRFTVSQAIASLPTLDLSAFSPDVQTLSSILGRFTTLETVSLDCLRLPLHSSILKILGPPLQQLSLFKCSSLSSRILAFIGQRCPNLRTLLVEFADQASSEIFKTHLVELFKGCLNLESLCIKIRGLERDASAFQSIELILPKCLKVLVLQPVLEQHAIQLICGLEDDANLLKSSSNFHIQECLSSPPAFALQSLSLVLDVISDDIVSSIVTNLPLLVELNLEDRPSRDPLLPRDLTNNGLQNLSSCQHLIRLSIIRNRHNCNVYFKRITDMGMLLLTDGCSGLESVTLGGFCKVTDAGFASILTSCQNLKKFEVHNAILLSDLAFHDIVGAQHSLIEFKLLSCGLITSEAMEELASSSMLEVVDLSGCRSIADACLNYISYLNTLTTLDIGGADVTDSGMAVLGGANLPIARLCLRGCKRVTDKGIAHLLHDGGTISKTLSSLDVGCMPGISDNAILTVASVAIAITELCIRYCFYVTDVSIEALASDRRLQSGMKQLKRLDLFHCVALSAESTEFLKQSSLCGLLWLGVGLTRLASKRDILSEIRMERPWLTLCFDGCEIGCHDGWQFHGSDNN